MSEVPFLDTFWEGFFLQSSSPSLTVQPGGQEEEKGDTFSKAVAASVIGLCQKETHQRGKRNHYM
jgi:hypothetical protein